ncbi:hypothetical protein ACU6T4_04140 [Avibacterium paragallinarum]|uniref:Uncharacterized protein n=1 Tax=Avibacterium paragallinarum TaxID=728 RepID=A0A0F5ES68_AVIPA|nr:hypothetical protein [Avibacterium paragallinarum]POY46517.1 hypothetical protein C3364_07015 [Avibacterium paragallinarum]QIR10903.1 hypothetical protein HBL79_00715 [Avibacterium paragallinarum]QJE10243.1 hypothetical protein HHJ62_08065 [Avibacterium paragallinarum]QJE12437.1 hypothetical protein HHJ61_08075 [Avibacterium paragallinarum]QJE14640.1 hypothetical protein HHJ60_08090 [Avibacterium paragallinarum]
MKHFLKVLVQFVHTKTDDDRKALFALLPKHILKHKAFFEKEMFADADQHTFYILTSLFIYWINELEESELDSDEMNLLDELQALFEEIDDDITETEQKKILLATKEIIEKQDSYSIHVKHLTKSEIQSLRESKKDAYHRMMAIS